MRRLSIFAKGNLDVRDTLHAFRIAGHAPWNGVNEILRTREPPALARVRHETFARSDALLAASGAVPACLLDREWPLGAFPLASQFSRAIFETDADAYVLSVQVDLLSTLLRHRREGFLLYPDHISNWSEAELTWLKREFRPEAALSVEASMANFAEIVARIRARSAAPILIYNASFVVPGEWAHCHQGLDETLSTRIRRFNLALVELSRQTGVSIVDVDAVVARLGSDNAKFDAIHLTAAGARAVCEEAVRILDDLGWMGPS